MIATTFIFVAAVAWLTPTSRQPVQLSTPALKQRLAETQGLLWAWEIEYESAREDRPGTPKKSYLHRAVATKAPDRFFHWSAHGTPWLDWRDDPHQQRLTVTANQLVSERPLDRYFIEQRSRPKDPLPDTASQELLIFAPAWWLLAQRPSPSLVDNLPASLSAVARSPKYQVQPQLEQVAGRLCHILECSGRDQLWLDVERGCAVVARQINYPRQNLVHRVEFSNFRELLPGIWGPFTLRNIHYERKPDGTLGKATLDATLTVLRIRLNEQVDDALFRFQPLPGSVGKIGGQPLRQVVPGGEEYLDEVVEWIHRYSPQALPPKSQSNWANWSDIALGALFGGVVVIGLFWRPHWKSRRGSEP